MAGGIDPPVKAMQAAGVYAVGHGLAGHPCRQKLPPRHDTVLALGEPSDHDIWMLVAFYVYMTSKAISVGHLARMATLIAHVARQASRLRAERCATDARATCPAWGSARAR